MSNVNRFVAVVIAGMLAVPNAFAQPGPSTPRIVTVRKDTALKFRTLKPLDSTTAKVGDQVPLRLDRPLVMDGITVLPLGFLAYGRVTGVKRAGPNGRYGEVIWRLDRISLPDSSTTKSKVWYEKEGDVAIPDEYYDLDAGVGGFTKSDVVLLSVITIVISPVLLIMMLFENDEQTPPGDEYHLPAASTVAVRITKNHRFKVCSN